MTTLYSALKHLSAKTSQLIYKANQLAGFHMIRAFTGRFFHTSNSNNEVKHFTLIILLFQKKCIKPGKIMELLGNSIQPIRRYSLQYPSPIFLSSIGSALSVLSIKVIVQSSKKTIMPMRSKMFKSICLHMFYPSFSFSVAILIVVPAITKWIGSRAYIFANHKFYTIKDKLDIYHSNSSCYFFCIAF